MKTREVQGPVTDPEKLQILENLESFWDAHALEGGSFRGDLDRKWWMDLIEQVRTHQEQAGLLFGFLRRDTDRGLVRAQSPEEWSAWQAIRAMVYVSVDSWEKRRRTYLLPQEDGDDGDDEDSPED